MVSVLKHNIKCKPKIKIICFNPTLTQATDNLSQFAYFSNSLTDLDTSHEEITIQSPAYSSAEIQDTTSNTYPNDVAPPPLKKRMLMKSYEENKKDKATEDMDSSLPVASTSVETTRTMKPPRTYSRKRKA